MFSLRRPGQVSLAGLPSRYRVDRIPEAALRIYTSPATLWALVAFSVVLRLGRLFGFEASDEVPRGSFRAYLRQPTPRLWVVLFHVGRDTSRREQDFLAALSHRGDALDEVHREGVSAYLYRMHLRDQRARPGHRR